MSVLAEYAGLLRVRRKWALRYTALLGILCIVALALVLGTAWYQRDRSQSSLDVLTRAILFMGPLLALAVQAAEYHRLKSELELLEVLQRAIGQSTERCATEDRPESNR